VTSQSSKSSAASVSSVSSKSAASAASASASASASAAARTAAFPIPTYGQGKPAIGLNASTNVCQAFNKNDQDTPQGWPSGFDHHWFEVHMDPKDDLFGWDAYSRTVAGVCYHLDQTYGQNAELWDPAKGWFFTWTVDNGPNHDWPATDYHNVTFGVQFKPEYRCGPDDCTAGKKRACWSDSYCPPPEDGKVGKDFWALDEYFSGRCTTMFYRALINCMFLGSGMVQRRANRTTGQSKKKGSEHWNLGGSYVDNGFLWSVWAPQLSSTYFWRYMGNGNEAFELGFSSYPDLGPVVTLLPRDLPTSTKRLSLATDVFQ